MSVRGCQHGRVDRRGVVRLGERCGGEGLGGRWLRLGQRLVGQKDESESRCGHFDLACIGIRVACDGLNRFLTLQNTVRLEDATKCLGLMSAEVLAITQRE